MIEDEDDDSEECATAPPTAMPPTAALEEIVEEQAPMEMVPKQEPSVVYEVILADAEPELS
jgi:hypothetical protein